MKKIVLRKVQNSLRKLFCNAVTFLKKILEDIIALIGITLLAIGVFKIYIPAGYITLGICFMALAFFMGKRGGKKC